jgi:hypothetical protein
MFMNMMDTLYSFEVLIGQYFLEVQGEEESSFIFNITVPEHLTLRECARQKYCQK